MDIMASLKFVGNNYDVILQAVVTVLGALGLVCETINRIIPNDGSESALSKVGKLIAKAGMYVQKAMDFLKIPNKKV